MVAVKTVLAKPDASGARSSLAAAAEQDLVNEALLMAQLDKHTHLVSLIGVVTRGIPKILVLSYCEFGELQGKLQKTAATGNAFDSHTKFRFCAEIADGMGHLAKNNFIHRDLATRNVLLASGMVCKIADFGLSRRVKTDDNASDYYTSATGGIMAVRWTAPEGLSGDKFSSASDVWSFGVTCIEIFQDGMVPYHTTKSNPAVMALVADGQVHPQPVGCSDQAYTMLVRCFAFKPAGRPAFDELALFFTSEQKAEPVGVAANGVGVTASAADTYDFEDGALAARQLQQQQQGSGNIDETVYVPKSYGWSKPRDVVTIYEDVGRPNLILSDDSGSFPAGEALYIFPTGDAVAKDGATSDDLASPYNQTISVDEIVQNTARASHSKHGGAASSDAYVAPVVSAGGAAISDDRVAPYNQSIRVDEIVQNTARASHSKHGGAPSSDAAISDDRVAPYNQSVSVDAIVTKSAKYTQADKSANDYDVSNEAPELLRKEIFRDPPPSIYEAITRTTHTKSNENHDDFYGITPVETPVNQSISVDAIVTKNVHSRTTDC
jgi:serine/threonine protein kinase